MKKRLALLLSTVMILSTFTACGNNNTDSTSVSATTTSLTETAENTDKTEKEETEAVDFFADGYDPFAEDYDPYGGNGAVGAEHTPETAEKEATAEETATEAVTETTTAEKEENKPVSDEKQTSSSEVSLVLNTSNSWDNGTDKFTQLDGTVKNHSDKSIGSCTVPSPAASGVSVDQFWNCEISVKGKTLTVTPVEHNSKIDI